MFVLPSSVSCSAHRVVSLSVVFISRVPSQCFVFVIAATLLFVICVFSFLVLVCFVFLFRPLFVHPFTRIITISCFLELRPSLSFLLLVRLMLIISFLFFFSSFSMDLVCWILLVFLLEITWIRIVKSVLDLILQCVGSLCSWMLCTYIHAYIHASWILDLLCWILFVFLCCRYRCCQYWIFSSPCWILSVALYWHWIFYCCSHRAQE